MKLVFFFCVCVFFRKLNATWMFCFVDLSDLDNVHDVLPQHGCEKQRHHYGMLISALFVKTEHKLNVFFGAEVHFLLHNILMSKYQTKCTKLI